MGYIEPLDPEDVDQENPEKVLFANEVFGNAIPPSFLPACEKGFREACNAGSLINHPVEVWPGLPVSASAHAAALPAQSWYMYVSAPPPVSAASLRWACKQLHPRSWELASPPTCWSSVQRGLQAHCLAV